jgi:hypothetical protein
VKKKRGQPKAHTLHQPPKELVKAEALPEWKRRKGTARHAKIPGGPAGPNR